MITPESIAKRRAAKKALELRGADRVVPVEPTAFADDCARRPKGTVQIGIRRLSEADLDTARSEAAKLAWTLHPDAHQVDERQETYDVALMRWAVARGTCRPDDVTMGYFRGDEDEVRAVLSPQGVRYLYEQVERVHIELSPLNAKIDRAGIVRLVGILSSLPGHDDATLFAELAPPKAARLRRLLAFVLDDLSTG